MYLRNPGSKMREVVVKFAVSIEDIIVN